MNILSLVFQRNYELWQDDIELSQRIFAAVPRPVWFLKASFKYPAHLDFRSTAQLGSA